MAKHAEILVAVDLGAGSGRVMAGRRTQDSLELREVHRFSRAPQRSDGFLRWDLEFLEASIREGVAKVGADETIVSLGIDSWAVDFVLVGTDGQPLEAPRAYRNEHTRALVEPTLNLLGEAAVYQRTGIQMLHFNTLFQLAAWRRSSPETLARARRFAMIPDWLAHRLGAPLVNEVTNASSTQMLDARTRDWDQATLGALGLSPQWFTKPVSPGTVLAPAVTLGAHRLALVAPATHDTGSAVAAIPLQGHSAYICTGTWCLIGIESKVPETGEAARLANFTNEAGVDGTYRFLKNCMGLWLIQQLKLSWSDCPDFGPLTAAAAAAPAFHALVDADDQSFFQPASMKQALEDWWTKTGQPVPEGPGGYARSCLESLVLAFRKTLEQIEAIRGTRLEHLHLVGGGCQNTLLCQLTADATGLPVWAGPIEASALGNLVVQARAMGWVADQAEARRLVERSFPLVEYRPRGDREAWTKAMRRLEELKRRMV